MSKPSKFKCPQCGASPTHHGRGECQAPSTCTGFLCECVDDIGPEHGETLADRCPNASCGHCDWFGAFPLEPKGLQAWEKKALAAGWTPPAGKG